MVRAGERFLEDPETETGTQALVMRNRSILLVVFCGSEGFDVKAAMRDWFTDASIWPVEVDGMQLHRGFHRALESIWASLELAIASWQGERALWLTGHSLGGALANLSAERLTRGGARVAGVTTFAAPKVGDCTFVTAFESQLGERSQQWSTRKDPVTRMPRLNDRFDYPKLGPTHIVDIDGRTELDTVLSMSGAPNPLAHRISSYSNYLYRALPEQVRARVPPPPPQCAPSDRHVGQHPETRYPLCLDRWRKISRSRCVETGGEVVDDWCVVDEPRMLRYQARKLKVKKNRPWNRSNNP
ncbi:MAG: lipase family protein [Acidobacteriota bacterium]